MGLSPSVTIALLFGALAAAPLFVSGYTANDVLARAMILALLAVALDLSWGYGGILSLGHSAFFGTGAYAMAILMLRWDSPAAPMVGLLLAVLMPAGLALLVGWFIFYGATSILYVAIVTLSLPLLLSAVDLRIPHWTGGLTGLSGIPSFPWSTPAITYYLLLAALAAGVLLVYRLTTSDFGRLLLAVRDNEQRARFLGYDTSIVRMLTFALSAALAGFAGALYAPYNGFVSYDLLGFVLSTNAIVWVTVGGRGTLAGPLLGALLINVLEPTLNAAMPGYWQLVLGFTFVVVILLFPSGIYGLLATRRPGVLGGLQLSEGRTGSAVRGDMTITVEHLHMGFGSLLVLQDVELQIRSGALHCLIGPNGAGKSTLVNAVTGLVSPTGGRVLLNGEGINSGTPDQIARRGIMRTFQASDVFETLSIGDNILLARGCGLMPSLVRRSRCLTLPAQAYGVLNLSGLATKLDERAGDLGHGERKWLELSMVLAAEPAIVFLDEPTAGLSAADRVEAGKVLVGLARDHGLGLLLIEHDLDFVRSIADRITVLSGGQVVADGTAESVVNSPVVRDVYVGSPTPARAGTSP
jgi:branched-chain amino acid transport system permease protein